MTSEPASAAGLPPRRRLVRSWPLLVVSSVVVLAVLVAVALILGRNPSIDCPAIGYPDGVGVTADDAVRIVVCVDALDGTQIAAFGRGPDVGQEGCGPPGVRTAGWSGPLPGAADVVVTALVTGRPPARLRVRPRVVVHGDRRCRNSSLVVALRLEATAGLVPA